MPKCATICAGWWVGRTEPGRGDGAVPDRRDRPLFLAQRGYRQRRVIDAARLLPVFGAFLLLVPVLWDVGGSGSGAPGAPTDPRLAERAVYIFAVWGLLVLAAAILGRRLREAAAPPRAPDASAGGATRAAAGDRPEDAPGPAQP